MSLKARITDDMKAAMKAKESARLAAIRLLLAAIKQKEVDERIGGKGEIGSAARPKARSSASATLSPKRAARPARGSG